MISKTDCLTFQMKSASAGGPGLNKAERNPAPRHGMSLFRRLTALTLALILTSTALLSAGCSSTKQPQRFQTEWTGSFDTVIQMIVYADNEQTFQKYVTLAKDRFKEMHQLFDRYDDYPGINNIKTINDQAGLEPVTVDQAIIDLLQFCQDQSQQTDYVVNIMLGPVLAIWHDYRDEALAFPERAQVPPIARLQAAAALSDPAGLQIDTVNRTVRLTRAGMSLDVGAVAKGYATERVAEALKTAGMTSGIVSAGGSNVRMVGKPADPERTTWNIGVQDPDGNLMLPESQMLDTISTTDTSIVTSGDYQRYYVVDGVVYHHLIDPRTLMPANYFRVVTIMTPDSGLADFLSSTLFLLPLDQGLAVLRQYPGTEALWVFADGTIRATEGMRRVLRNQTALPAE